MRPSIDIVISWFHEGKGDTELPVVILSELPVVVIDKFVIWAGWVGGSDIGSGIVIVVDMWWLVELPVTQCTDHDKRLILSCTACWRNEAGEGYL